MNIDRNKLIKSFTILAAMFILVFGLTQIMKKNSVTLTEYAAKHPATTKTEPTEQNTGDTEDSASTSDQATEILQNQEDSSPATVLTGATLNADTMTEQRITYADSFYYEPLSDNLRRYMTGVSFPVSPSSDTTGIPENNDISEVSGTTAVEEEVVVTYDELRYVHILHYDFDGNLAEGELICNEYIAQDLLEIFYELYLNEYQLEKVHLIDEYDGDDTASMEDNNTSCFNYRVVPNSTSLSKHALGLAIDINPLYNPYITYEADGSENISPAGASAYANRRVNFPYKIDENDLCYKLFTEHGFTWGGNWNSCKDYQHFQKTMPH